MKVNLIQHTEQPLRLMYAQTRGTTTSKGFAEVWENPTKFFPKKTRQAVESLEYEGTYPEYVKAVNDEMIRLVDDALFAGHTSVSRGVSFTFGISCSRSTGRQMLRHVVGVAWEEMSQRYVKLANKDTLARLSSVLGSSFGDICDAYSEYFEIPEHIYSEDSAYSRDWFKLRLGEVERYLSEILSGVPAEDARENLPNCTRTEMICTMSFEALKTFLAKRLCTRAQEPIREVAKQMRKQVVGEFPWTGKHLTVQCLPACICPESNPMGCPLLAENGGNVLRKEQALDSVRQTVRELKAK